jgi:2-polyprenyl-3-methyl-5-hydroxy-6-metoxy-1,4-benzoquinol methylase
MNYDIISYSEASSELIYQIEKSIREKYISYEIQTQEYRWVDLYNNTIKSEDWPTCKTYDDFDRLPEHIQEECINVHHFSPEIFRASIIDDANAKFSKRKELVFPNYIKDFLLKNIHILRGKKVVDLACGYGQWSIFSHRCQCLNVIGMDVRDENIAVAKSTQNDFGISNDELTFIQADIHNHNQLKELCSDKDTVLLFGIMNHVHDHFDILKATCQPSVLHVVIETGEDVKDIKESVKPLIRWMEEPTFLLTAGSADGTDLYLAGHPNVVWFDLAMKNLGFKRISTSSHEIYESIQNLDEFKVFRSIFLYERIL